MSKIVVNIVTGETSVEAYTSEELAERAVRLPEIQAAEAAQAALEAERQDVKQDAFTQAIAGMTKAEVLDAAETALAGLPVAARNFLKKHVLITWIDVKEKYK